MYELMHIYNKYQGGHWPSLTNGRLRFILLILTVNQTVTVDPFFY